MMILIKRFFQDESGATAIEYGLIATLVSIGIIAGAMSLGNTVGNTFNYTAEQLENANSDAFSD